MRARVFCGRALPRPPLSATAALAPRRYWLTYFVAGPPDPGFQLDDRVLVKRGELVPLGLGDQQPLGVVEDREQRRIHRSSSIPPEGLPA